MPSNGSTALPIISAWIGFSSPVGGITQAIRRHHLHRRHAPGVGQRAKRSFATERTFQDLARDMPSRIMLLSGNAKTLAGAIQRNFHGGQGSPVEAFRDDHGPLLEVVRSAPVAPRSHVFRALRKNCPRTWAERLTMPACFIASAFTGPGLRARSFAVTASASKSRWAFLSWVIGGP